jgi:4-hydroxybenzoate polyprenyltransferase
MRLLSFALGSTLLHSAACVINDISDRDFDRQVGEFSRTLCLSNVDDNFLSSERCKNRPIAKGDVSVTGASIFLIIILVPCLSMLLLTNEMALWVALPGIFPLHALYVISINNS